MPHQPDRYPSQRTETPDYATVQSGVFDRYEEHNLKDLSEGELLQSLLEIGDHWTESDRTLVVAAYHVGSAVHWKDTHKGLPYTYHLLRNANRISRYAHIYEAEVLAGEILHDSVEDHPDDLAAYDNPNVMGDESQKRRAAYDFLRATFTPRVAVMVEGMTNPLPETAGPVLYGDKIEAYVGHIAVAVRNPDVFFGKWADWTDNGIGVEYGKEDLTQEQSAHFMYKYGRVLPVLESRFYESDIQAILDPVAKANIARTFDLARQRLHVPAP